MSQLRLDPAAYMTQHELRQHMKLLLRLQRQLRLDPDSRGHRKALFEIAFQIYHYCDRIDYSQDDYHHQLKPKVAWGLRLAARDASMMGKKSWNRSLINRLVLLRTKPDIATLIYICFMMRRPMNLRHMMIWTQVGCGIASVTYTSGAKMATMNRKDKIGFFYFRVIRVYP